MSQGGLVVSGPPDSLLEKLANENPHWTVDDWAAWWGKWLDTKLEKLGITLADPAP